MINRGVGVVAGAGLAARPGRGRGRRDENRLRLERGRTRSRSRVRTTMPTFAYSGRTRAGQTVSGERVGRHDGRGRRRRCGASRSWSRGSRRPRPRPTPAKKERRARSARRSSAKNLAVFTRQFSVMIDAGLPLVQCLDILGTQEEDKNFAAVILADAHRRRVGRVAGRRDAQASRRPSIRCSRT